MSKKTLFAMLVAILNMLLATANAYEPKIVLYPTINESLLQHYKFPSTHFEPYPQSSILALDVLSSLSPGDRVTMIVGGETLEVITTSMKKRSDGFTWSGKPEGLCSWDTIVITVLGDTAFGSMFRGERSFKIRPSLSNGIVLVEEENPAFEMPIGDDVLFHPNLPSPAISSRTESAYSFPTSPHTIVDLMVYYTPAVESYLGGSSSVRAGIQHLVDLVNEAYTNSLIDLELRLVHIEKVYYTDDGSTAQPLYDLTDARDVFQNMPFLRDKYGADLVTLLRRFNKSSNDSCGRAWMLNSLSNKSWSSEKLAFSVVQVGRSADGSGYYCSDLTLAHETGHNFGCQHDRAHASGPGIFEYSYGYYQPGVSATIMSYGSPTIPYYSNPDIKYQGYPIGVPAGSPNAADNSRTIRETKDFIASYRSATFISCNTDDRIQKIYIAYYQRPGDPGGISYWSQRLNQAGGNLSVVINPFATSPEAQSLYGQINSSTIGNVIDAIYMALFNRTADPAGKQYYIDGFMSGRFTPGTIALNILDGARGSDLTAINNKLTIANEFTCQVQIQNVNYAGDSDANRARQFLRTVTADPESVTNARQNLQQLLNEIRP